MRDVPSSWRKKLAWIYPLEKVGRVREVVEIAGIEIGIVGAGFLRWGRWRSCWETQLVGVGRAKWGLARPEHSTPKCLVSVQ